MRFQKHTIVPLWEYPNLNNAAMVLPISNTHPTFRMLGYFLEAPGVDAMSELRHPKSRPSHSPPSHLEENKTARRGRAEGLAAGQSRLLEMIATDVPFFRRSFEFGTFCRVSR